MQLHHFADDPLERYSQEAVNSTLRMSCNDLRYFDYMCWKEVIDSLATDSPLVMLSSQLTNRLKKASDEMIKRLCSGAVATFAFRRKRSLKAVPVGKQTMRMYILQHKYTAAQFGYEYATQVYGISYAESCAISKASGFMDNLRSDSYSFELRCSEKVLCELLKAKSEDKSAIERLRIRKIQECLTEEKTTKPECSPRDTLASYDPDTEEGRANIDSSKKLLARRMLIQGYTTHTVSVELGLSLRQCRHVAEHTKSAKYLDSIPSSSASAGGVLKPYLPSVHSSKSNKTSQFILRCKETVMNASLIMRIYISLGGDETKTATQISMISIAYSLYCAARHDVYGLAERSGAKRLTIQDAWILAVDYRSRRGYLDTCRACKSDIFRSTIQRQDSCSCPFCS